MGRQVNHYVVFPDRVHGPFSCYDVAECFVLGWFNYNRKAMRDDLTWSIKPEGEMNAKA